MGKSQDTRAYRLLRVVKILLQSKKDMSQEVGSRETKRTKKELT